MSEVIKEMNGVTIFEYEYDKYKGKNDLNSLEAEGMCFRLADFLQTLGYDESAWDVYENTSGIRDGNRLDIHDNYMFEEDDNLEITFIYSINGTVWAVLYDTENDSYYGEFELLPV